MMNIEEFKFKNLIDCYAAGRLPHALLVCGEQGMDQLCAAQGLAQLLLCQNRTQAQYEPCTHCKACQLFAAQTHPDYYQIYPEQSSERQSKEIKIDQIRALNERVTLKSQYQGLKIALIYPADRLNRNAANSLLKTLEEPPEGTLLVLLSSFSGRLPATIRSRCQKLIFNPPNKLLFKQQLAEQFPGHDIDKLMAISNGSIQNTKAMLEGDWLDNRDKSFKSLLDLAYDKREAIEVAKYIQNMDIIEPFLSWLASWVEDIIRLKMGVQTLYLKNQDYISDLSALSQFSQIDKVVSFYADILKARQLLVSSVNLQLLIESVLLSWALMFFQNAESGS